MADRYHINPETGNPNKCDAKIQCRFGSDSPHFDSKDAARNHFEKENAGEALPVSEKISISVLNKIAKGAYEPETLKEISERGSERTLKLFAENKNATSETLATAFRRTSNDETRILLQKNSNFPLDMMTDEGWEAISRHNPAEITKRFSSGEISDEQVVMAAKYRRWDVALGVSKNPDAELSNRTRSYLVETDRYSLQRGLKNDPKYDAKARLPYMDPKLFETVIEDSSDPETIHEAVARRLAESDVDKNILAQKVAQNSKSDESTLNLMARASDNAYAQTALYYHDNATETTKSLLAEKSSTLKSVKNLDSLEESDPNNFKKLMEARPVQSGTNTNTIQFDPELVKSFNLSSKDVDSLVRFKMKNWLQHPTYNPETGVFTGSID